MPDMTHSLILYFSCIIAVALLVTIVLHVRTHVIESRRRKRLKKQDEYDVTPLDFNQSIDSEEMLENRLQGVSARFDIFRRAMYFSIWLLAAFMISIPVMQKFSPSLSPILIAAASVIVGIAAKPVVENMICGAVLAFGKIARIGDTVLVDGEYGVIESVTLTHCVIKRWDWLRYIIPNSTMLTKEFVNYSIYDNNRWVYVEFWVDYDADLDEVRRISLEAPKGSKFINDAEDTRFWVVDMDKDAVKCMVVAWTTQPSDGWMLSIDIRSELVKQLKKKDIKTQGVRIVGNMRDPRTMANN
ncbi:MAG: mechanosensitive ion channel family protein [Planctomycetes bacterium]|nr:mechanosensitive ion channel family protein [Planctomycetota bacterium]